MRMGQTDRAIARTKLMGRLKCAQVRALAEQNGWLAEVPLLVDQSLANIFKCSTPNAIQDSRCLPHEDQIQKRFNAGVKGTIIHRALVEKFAFSGSYSSVRRLLQKLHRDNPAVRAIWGSDHGGRLTINDLW
jgi:hypothetical protein